MGWAAAGWAARSWAAGGGTGGLGGDGFGQPTRRAGRLCWRGRGEKMSPFPVYPPLRHPFFSVDTRSVVLFDGRFPRRGQVVPRSARRWRDAPWPMAFGGKRTRVGGEDGGGLGRQWVGRRRVGSGGLGGGGLGNGGLGNGGPGNGGLENGGLGGGGLGGGGLGGGVLGVGGFGRRRVGRRGSWAAVGWAATDLDSLQGARGGFAGGAEEKKSLPFPVYLPFATCSSPSTPG